MENFGKEKLENMWAKEGILTEPGEKPKVESMPTKDIEQELNEVTAQVELAQEEINKLTEEMAKSAKGESVLSEDSINAKLRAIKEGLLELRERKEELEEELRKTPNKQRRISDYS